MSCARSSTFATDRRSWIVDRRSRFPTIYDLRSTINDLLFNLTLGIVPTLVLAGSIAAGIDDDRQHRRMFLFVYGLWAITLAMWNWMRSAPVGWTVVWAAAGVAAIAFIAARRE